MTQEAIRANTPKFYLHSFSRVISMDMNPLMAIQICTFVAVNGNNNIPKELYAATEKIRTQLFHMGLLPQLEAAIEEGKVKDVATTDSTSSGELDAGTREAA